MKIAIFYFGDKEFRYGVEKVLLRLMNELVLYHDVYFIFSGSLLERPAEISNKVNTLELHKTSLRGAALSLVRSLFEIRPDVLVSSTEHPNFLCVLIKILSRGKYKLILTTHSPISPRIGAMWGPYQSLIVKAAIYSLYPFADELVAVSSSTAKDLLKYLPLHSDVKVIYNPVLTGNHHVHNFQERLCMAKKNLLYVGRLVHHKRVHLIIEAMALLDNAFHLDIVGDGPDRQQIEAMVIEKDLAHRVSFHGFQEQVNQFYENSAVLILPSSFEGFGNVLIEAMSKGCQIVVPQTGDAQCELIDNGRFGYTFDPEDIQSLVIAISEAINYPKPYAILINWANRFSQKQTALSYLRLLKKNYTRRYPRLAFRSSLKSLAKRYLLGQDCQCSVCGQWLKAFDALSNYYHMHFRNNTFRFGLDEFETFNWRQYKCPYCKASDRDRLYSLYLDTQQDHEIVEQWIDFAPTESFTRFVLSNFRAITYMSADLSREGVDIRLDIQNMWEIADNSINFIICSHVLEHVCDDRKALQELFRILCPGGQAIIMAPVIKTLDADHELPITLTEETCWREHGQGDHRRIYSPTGLHHKITSAGFDLERIVASEFGLKRCRRHGINPTSVLYIAKSPVYHTEI